VTSRAKDSATGARIWRVEGGRAEAADDRLATEEPLEIRLLWGGERRTVAVTMRTPGADAELAAGACVVLTAAGRIEAGLEAQLDELARVLLVGGAP